MFVVSSANHSISHTFQLFLLVESLQPDHEHRLFILDLFQCLPVELDRAVLVPISLELVGQISNEFCDDRPGLFVTDDIVQIVEFLSKGKCRFFQSKNKQDWFKIL